MLGDSMRRRRGGGPPPNEDGPEDSGGSGEAATGPTRLGSSLRRSSARRRDGRWGSWLGRGADAGRRMVDWAGGPGGPWLIAAAVVLVGSFVVGYLLSTQVLFPRPETAGTGIAVPSLYGETRAAAESSIRGAGLVVGEVTELANRDVERGTVVAQEPVPGQQLRSGGLVSFAVSAGAPVVRVPPVRGLGEETARELLEAVGFDVDVEPVEDTGLPGGAVTGADPPAGTQRELPSRVTLYVALEQPDSLDPGLSPVGGGERPR